MKSVSISETAAKGKTSRREIHKLKQEETASTRVESPERTRLTGQSRRSRVTHVRSVHLPDHLGGSSIGRPISVCQVKPSVINCWSRRDAYPPEGSFMSFAQVTKRERFLTSVANCGKKQCNDQKQ